MLSSGPIVTNRPLPVCRTVHRGNPTRSGRLEFLHALPCGAKRSAGRATPERAFPARADRGIPRPNGARADGQMLRLDLRKTYRIHGARATPSVLPHAGAF